MSAKDKARAQSKVWWGSPASANSRGRGFAICDGCNGQIPVDGGCLCQPAYASMGLGGPDLVCEGCFDRRGCEPWEGELPSSRPFMSSKKKWWQFWK